MRGQIRNSARADPRGLPSVETGPADFWPESGKTCRSPVSPPVDSSSRDPDAGKLPDLDTPGQRLSRINTLGSHGFPEPPPIGPQNPWRAYSFRYRIETNRVLAASPVSARRRGGQERSAGAETTRAQTRVRV